MKIPDRPDAEERHARIDRMIKNHRLAKHRQLMRLARKVWRQTATDRLIAKLDGPVDLIH